MGRYPWAVRAGGPLLGGGGLPTLFGWTPVNGQTLPSGTFTRGSVAQEFDGASVSQLGVNGIRENSAAVGGGPKGYLPEPQATNQMPSQDLASLDWATSNMVITDEGVGSLGLNEFEIDDGLVSNSHFTFDSAISFGAGSAYLIAKQITGRYINLRRGGSNTDDYATFDLQAGVSTDKGANIGDAFTIVWSDGWYRTEMNGSDITQILLIATSLTGTPGTAIPGYQGAEDLWRVSHVQREDTDYSTSPILTTGAAETRAPDILDTDVDIPSEYGLLLDVTLPIVIGTGNTISLMGADASAVDVLRLDASFDVIMDDGGTPVTVGTASPGARIKVSYGRDPTGRSASLDGATAVNGGAPGAAHEGESFQLGCTNSVNQSRSIHHATTIFSVRPSDAELEQLSS